MDTGRERLCTAALIVLVAVLVGALLTTDLAVHRSWAANRELLVRNALRLASDDGFYYLEIAKNVAQGAGSTFDEVHPTNGYHPLWMLGLVPVFWLTTDPETAFLAVTLLQAVLLLLSCGVLAHTLRLEHGWPVAVLATLAWVRLQASHWVVFFGLEYALQTLLVCMAGYYYLRDFAREPPAADRPYLRLGVVLALCFLARLETAVLAVFLIASILHSLPAEGRRRRAFLLLATPLLVSASGYVLINSWMFGHPLPVSGAVKAARSELLLRADVLASSQGYFGVKLAHLGRLFSTFNASLRLPLLFGLFAPLALCALPKRALSALPIDASRSNLRSWWPFVAYSWVHFALIALVFHGGESYKPWYFVVPLWLAVIVGATMTEALARAPTARAPGSRRRRAHSTAFERGRALILLVLTLALLASLTTNLALWRHALRRPPVHATLLQEATWIRDNVPPGAFVGSWNAGVVGYFSEHQVVNLDGLVNSWRYFQEGRFDLCRYWRETGIEYLVDMFPTDDELAYLDEGYARWSDIHACRDRLALVWRGRSGGEWSPTAFRIIAAEDR